MAEQARPSGLTYDSKRDDEETNWSSLSFTNDYVFGAVLKSNLDVTRRLLECVLDIPVERVELVENQHEGKPSKQAKGVRLDAYVRDGSGRVFDVEMQQYQSDFLTKRARYYQAVMDTEQLSEGTSYKKLPDTFVIFFCTFDPFKRGLRRYTYRQACVEDGSFSPWDGTAKVYLNARGTQGVIGNDLQGILDYMAGHNVPDNELVQDIEQAVDNVLSSEERRRDYMDMQLRMEEDRQQAMEKGLEQGRAQGRAEGLAEGLSKGVVKGQEKAMRLLSQLSEALMAAGRQDELPKAIADPKCLDALCEEFGIGQP